MEKMVYSKGVILFYLISILATYLVILRVDSLNNNIAKTDNQIVYQTTENID